jgi:hypothetical protein
MDDRYLIVSLPSFVEAAVRPGILSAGPPSPRAPDRSHRVGYSTTLGGASTLPHTGSVPWVLERSRHSAHMQRPDAVFDLEWQTTAEARAKDAWERSSLRAER